MSTIHCYSGSILAADETGVHNAQIRHRPAIILAASEQEANTEALRLAHEAFPDAEGWGKHNAVIMEVPYNMIITAFHYHPEHRDIAD